MDKTGIEEPYKYWRKRVFIALWITYGSFYLGRANLSIAIPQIMSELGYSKTEVGAIFTVFFVTCGIGQVINGQLGDRYGGRILITIGLLMVAFLNISFGFSTGLGVMIFIWAINGFFQSLGWAPSVKTLANWFHPEERGKISGVFGTTYQIGNAYSWALAGFITGLLGWRWAFWLPGLILIFSAFHWLLRGRNAPEEVGLPILEEERNKETSHVPKIKKDEHLGFRYTLNIILNPKIWAFAIAYFFLSLTRHGFMAWMPTYLFEVQKSKISTAAYKAMTIPLAGAVGSISAGWVSDRYFSSRRTPVISIGLFLLSIFTWLFTKVPSGNLPSVLVCLLLIGFFTYGPHVLLSTAIPMDFGTRKGASSVAGFIDGFGYLGAALTGIGSGWLVDNFGWNAAFNLWISSAFVAAILMALLWNVKATEGEYF